MSATVIDVAGADMNGLREATTGHRRCRVQSESEVNCGSSAELRALPS